MKSRDPALPSQGRRRNPESRARPPSPSSPGLDQESRRRLSSHGVEAGGSAETKVAFSWDFLWGGLVTTLRQPAPQSGFIPPPASVLPPSCAAEQRRCLSRNP